MGIPRLFTGKVFMAMSELSGMDDSLYEGNKEEKPDSKPESVDEQEAMDATTLVDLKVLTGKDGVKPKVGEERVVKVVAIHGDQAEISYAPEKPEEEEPKGEEADPELAEVNSRY